MSRTARVAKVAVCTFALLAASSWFPARLSATTYHIATTADDAIDNGNCTLREALRAANMNFAVDLCPAGGADDAISLPTGTYPFSGQEALSLPGRLSIQSQSLNPFDVKIALGSAGRFLYLVGGGEYTLGGIEIADGERPDGVGGAISAYNVSLTLFNFRFSGNSAIMAGALSFNSTAPAHNLSLRNGSFLSNNVVNSEPETGTAGGALAASAEGGARIDIRDVAFIGNSLLDTLHGTSAGALSLSASGIGSVASCIRCNFQDNRAESQGLSSAQVMGGAVDARAYSEARVEIVDSRFTGNSAEAAEAGMTKCAVLAGSASSGGSILLERLFIDANAGSLPIDTRDVALSTNDAGSSISFLNSQVAFGVGSGVRASVTGGTIRLGHLTVADYELEGMRSRVSGSGTISLENSIVTSNGSNLTLEEGELTQVTNSIGGSMLFVNQSIGDYHLTGASPAVNSGTNGAATVRLADLDFRGRVAGSATDRGCYEFNSIFAHSFDIADYGGWSNFVP